MAKHVIVLSADAMVFEDTEILKKIPPFNMVWDKTARVDRVKSVYPTITYPCHSTMQTGVYPDKHGILYNDYFMPGERKIPWIHFRESIKAPTIFDAVKAADPTLKTAAVFWPVTGNDKNIDYLVDEYWPQTPDESTLDCYRASGSSEEVIEKIVAPNMHYVEGHHRQHPYCDDFIAAMSCAMIREFKPNLLLIHPANIDAYRHGNGLFNDIVTHGIHETATWFTQMIKACEDAGILDDTDFFLVSDHGQIDITQVVAVNALLAEKGWIDVDENGNVKSWRAFVKSGGTSALVYTNGISKEEEEELHKQLCDLRDDGVWGIGDVFTKEEAAVYHIGGDFTFVLETNGHTSFSSDWQRPFMKQLGSGDYRYGKATHGHLPHKGPTPTLVAFGPDMKEGAVLANAELVDEAPTFAHCLGIEMKNTDGRVLTELFK